MHKTEGMVKMSNSLFTTYKKNSMPNGKHMFQNASYMSIATIYTYVSSKYPLSNCIFVLHCCAQCPRIDISSP